MVLAGTGLVCYPHPAPGSVSSGGARVSHLRSG